MYHKNSKWVKIVAFVLAGLMILGIVTSALFTLL